MLTYSNNLIQELENKLQQINTQENDTIKKVEKSINIIQNSINHLKNFVAKHEFQSKEQEINFFKEVKPYVFSKMVYFAKVFNIESKRPNGTFAAQKRFYVNELHEIERFFNANLDFYQYIRSKSTYLDDKYFLRNNQDMKLFVDSALFNTDTKFSTGYDQKLAIILANDLLEIYIKSELSILENKELAPLKATSGKQTKFIWTDSKIALIELIYALQETKCINKGKVEIRELAAFFETTLHVQLGDYYRGFLELKGRNQQTKFIDQLHQNLLNRIEEEN